MFAKHPAYQIDGGHPPDTGASANECLLNTSSNHLPKQIIVIYDNLLFSRIRLNLPFVFAPHCYCEFVLIRIAKATGINLEHLKDGSEASTNPSVRHITDSL